MISWRCPSIEWYISYSLGHFQRPLFHSFLCHSLMKSEEPHFLPAFEGRTFGSPKRKPSGLFCSVLTANFQGKLISSRHCPSPEKDKRLGRAMRKYLAGRIKKKRKNESWGQGTKYVVLIEAGLGCGLRPEFGLCLGLSLLTDLTSGLEKENSNSSSSSSSTKARPVIRLKKKIDLGSTSSN